VSGGFGPADHAHMARALQLAALGRYTTRPNPMVGCVVVRDGAVVGEGWHRRAGEPHAEVLALAEAGARARGATAYVTLEPCAHHGRTPPCADALVRAGVTRVVAACEDPFHKVAGQGLAMLRAAGVEVQVGLMREQALALNRAFISRNLRGRPWVRVKLAMSLDGRTALADGESRWITSEAARLDGHRWRARAGAILTGLGTVRADDPRLTVRLPPGPDGAVPEVATPLRVVLDTRGRLPADAGLVRDGEAPTLLVHADDFVPAYDDHVEAFPVRRLGERLDLSAVLSQLAQRGIGEVHVEAGPTLSGALLAAGLVDELLVYLAPVLLGARGRPLVEGLDPTTMTERFRLELLESLPIGPDLRLLLRPTAAN